MIINTTSKHSMETDVAKFLDITVEELYQYIDYASEKATVDSFCFREDVFFQELNSIISDLQPENIIEEVFCFHLSRRLNTCAKNLTFCNLKELLLTQNEFSDFLRKFNIVFFEKQGRISFTYNRVQIPIDNTENNAAGYLRARFYGEDFCFNGFALRDQLLNNSYARELYDGPEFLQRLSEYLNNPQILSAYKESSTYYCYHLKMPFSEVVFDEAEELQGKEKELYFIDKICSRLFLYSETKADYISDNDNPIFRANDFAIIPSEYVVHKEELTFEMLR